MAEQYPSDAALNALSGTADAEQEVLHPAIGESPYYTSFYKMLTRLLLAARRAGDLRVFKDGPLTFGVRAGSFFDGDTLRTFQQADGQALTDNATNYVYVSADGTLHVNTTGFPVPSATPHIRLAAIVTSGGSYDGRPDTEGGDVADCRGAAMFAPASGLSADLVDGETITLTEGGLLQVAAPFPGIDESTITLTEGGLLQVPLGAGLTTDISGVAVDAAAIIDDSTITLTEGGLLQVANPYPGPDDVTVGLTAGGLLQVKSVPTSLLSADADVDMGAFGFSLDLDQTHAASIKGDGSGALAVDAFSVIFSNGQSASAIFLGLPVGDPEEADQLYEDPSTHAVMVSQGS